MPLYYFAYGSNMNESRILSRDVEFSKMFSGKLKDWKLVFDKKAYGKKGVAYANIVPESGLIVEGIIYEITEKSVSKLDVAEGFPKHYQKSDMLVESDNGDVIKCLVYVANPVQVMNGLKPEKSYISHLLEGKKFLTESYFSWLRQTSTID